MTEEQVEAFIAKWEGVEASELATSQSFLMDLCTLLGVDRPHPTPEQDYMFERPVTFVHGDGTTSPGRIDLYRRGALVLESKKLRQAPHTRGFDEAMLRARSQAESYARALPAQEGRPPFVVVVDVGHRIELYAEFTRSGATYTPYPDPRSHRIKLPDLRRPEILDRLRRIWTDPMSLDPSRESARVTRAIAAKLAELARSLERAGHHPEEVAQFLMRCLFTMFAEDVGLLPSDAFRDLLLRYRDAPDVAMRMTSQLWREMDEGGFSAVLATDILKFNGRLFKQSDALPLTKPQIQQLIDSANADWRHVEPAIFGTLLERALDPEERHQLGAHYTPRAYVERLVYPTVIEPLRREWADAQAAAMTLEAEGKDDEAVKVLLAFHHRLCTLRVLDPACGSGNFLYVTLEHLKRLEGEVLDALDGFGHKQEALAIDRNRSDYTKGETVDPHNLLGIELNPRAAAIAEVVLWIGFLQWHFRTHGNVAPPQPVVRDFGNIECRDAVLAWDDRRYLLDERGIPVTRWDGKTMKPSPVTGEPVPDEAAQTPVEEFINPRMAAWPAADFVVGNPPFIGNKRMRLTLGDGYVEALRRAWPGIPESADFVMFWWHHAAALTRRGALERFGLITTNSLRQAFNRRVVEPHLADSKQPLSLVFAIPDHPWVDSADGAAVRIAMTVGQSGSASGLLCTVQDERPDSGGEIHVRTEMRRGIVHSDLRVGPKVGLARRLRSNSGLCGQGVKVVGDGFYLDNGDDGRCISRIINARDILDGNYSGRPIIDFFELSESAAREMNPSAYQQVLTRVKPLRDKNSRKSIREIWWRFAWERPVIRKAVRDLNRYFVTLSTSKHRFFVAVDPTFVWDGALFAVASDDWLLLSVLSSAVHWKWSLAAGGTLEDRPTWTNSTCFEPFPFPETSEIIGSRLRELGEQLDTHRKQQQSLHPGLTVTAMYNTLEKLRTGEPLNTKDRTVHDQGLVSVLKQIHDELDEAVLDAYGWSDLIPMLAGDSAAFTDAVLERLVALNTERAAEEGRGLVRWLRPEFQNPDGTVTPEQADLDTAESEAKDVVAPVAKRTPWPKDSVEQVRAVANLLASSPAPLTEESIAAAFTARGPWKRRLGPLLEMLVAVGRVTRDGDSYRFTN